ncbi:sugar ABC transporter permease [Curtobacterium sp. VKM Ac-2865]|uniref:carbohydrate ABC transporter permease n=1 Tax=Curtobacterium sp. VKM Ac-2865 TaxID=2783817 RepID=UPI00188BA344|nr:sugar ABC transporter permease [Curtobacterium sp. VKM Ac-2865]MBF4581069.1 sugar ABC transporter permease [Curtobacterium sp. VKM Ac-2865]
MSVVTTPEEQAVVAGEADDALDATPPRRRRTERGSGVSATRKQQTRAAWVFLALPGALFLLFTALPVVIAAVVSLSDYAVIGPLTWTGFDNYVDIASDPFFWIALRNTVLYTVLYVPLGLVIAMATALLLNRSARSARVFRTLFYIPVVSSTVATATIWYWVLDPQHGLLNEALSWFGINGPAWLYDSHWAMTAIVMMSVWAGFGGNMMIFLGGLQGVSPDLREAARLDGANAWQVFRYVVVPSVRRTTFLVSTLLIINAFQVFDQAYVLTKGGPGNSTVTIVYYIYDRGFGSLQMGYASALSFILFVIILAFSLVNARLTNRDTDR